MKISRKARIGAPIAAFAVALAAFAPVASAHGAGGSTSFPVVDSFKAGKYRVFVGGAKGGAALTVSKGRSSAFYAGGGTTSAKKIKAKLGSLGKIKLTFHKSGKAKKSRPKGCHGGKPDKTQKGTWTGKVKFKGEGGYVKVNEHKLKGSNVKLGTYTCNSQPPPGGQPKKFVSLSASKNANGGFTGFNAQVKKSGGKPLYSANESSASGKLHVFRTVSAKGKKTSFKYNAGYSHATVKPGGLFKGTGKYDQSPEKGASTNTFGSFSGLKVSFLGDKNVKLNSTPNGASLGEIQQFPFRSR